jgi:hypothetical protein
MAPLPHEEMAKVEASKLSGKRLLRCCETIQASKEEKSREVDMPPRTRPIMSTGIDGTFSSRWMTISRT